MKIISSICYQNRTSSNFDDVINKTNIDSYIFSMLNIKS